MHADIELAHQFHQAGGAGSTSPSRARSLHLNKLYLHSSSLTAGSEYLGIIPTSSLTSEFASPRKRDWAKEGVGRAVGGVSARTRFGAAVHHDKSGIIYGQDARAGRHEKVDYAELARNLINEERRSVPRRDHAEESRVRSAGRLWREFARSAGVIMTNYTGRADHDYTQDVDVEPYGGSSRSDGNVLVMSDNEFDVPMCSFSSPARQPQSKNYYHYVPEDRAGRSGASAVRSLTSQPISSSSRTFWHRRGTNFGATERPIQQVHMHGDELRLIHSCKAKVRGPSRSSISCKNRSNKNPHPFRLLFERDCPK
eukprot:g10058.t1